MGGSPGMGMGGPGGMMMGGGPGGMPGMGMMMRHYGPGGAPMNVIINVGPGIRVEIEDQDRQGRGGPAGRMMTGAPRGGAMGPGMMMDPDGMRPFERIEGRLAYYRAELGITEAQMPQWNAFADAMRAAAARLRQAYAQAMQAAAQAGTAPEQIERWIALLSARLEAIRSVADAARSLYATLSEQQKRTADALMAEHFRALRGHGP
ncbi:Spy/CpxP family protein refolding chaperone [Caldovatus aquaticus]|uniref:Spy/CpxP family protein refolding chaperone n=1 Tax=Caldovatus aquaticus TaxID=2865671 RepID=A0ABS7F3V3_9PROT|nr:Spy/CpxP family protein refolding chaperone [Caldovatus aquaticus]MBW8269485.1 Spy/CpxP family protein refolding chaperone [Caldovatus aquaticus]